MKQTERDLSKFPSRMITLNAVGFMAAVTARLAHAGISVNPVSGFHHDHLFVPADRADEAMRLLTMPERRLRLAGLSHMEKSVAASLAYPPLEGRAK